MAEKKKAETTLKEHVDNARRTIIPGQMAKDLFEGVLSKMKKATKKKK